VRLRSSVPPIGFTLLFIGATTLRAQGFVGGVAADAATGARLPCVDVTLEDTLGRVVARGQTTAEGMFQFDAPAPGDYRFRFAIWNHIPIVGPTEALDPTSERARSYQLSFVSDSTKGGKLWPDTTDSPPGPPPREADRALLRYPFDLRVAGVQGEVRVTYAVDSVGWVQQPTVHMVSADHFEFARAVRMFLAKVQFAPARRDGRAVCALMVNQPFTFSLRSR
jgi:TonB family protein